MRRRLPRSSPTDTLCPYTTLFRSHRDQRDDGHPPHQSPVPRPGGSRGVVVVEGGAHDHGRLHGPIKGQGQGERPAGGDAVWIWTGPFPVPSPRIKLALIAFASAIPDRKRTRLNSSQ